MITKWKVSNFKSIRDEVELDLGKLTVFSGVNSVGKSTLIQSILLIVQTLRHKGHRHSIALNGNIVNLGAFDDIKPDGSKSNQTTIEFECHPTSKWAAEIDAALRKSGEHEISEFDGSKIENVSCAISFGTENSTIEDDDIQQWPQLTSADLSGKFSAESASKEIVTRVVITKEDDVEPKIEKLLDKSDAPNDLRDGLSYNIKLDRESLSVITNRHLSAIPAGCLLHHFLPSSFIVDIDVVEEAVKGICYTLQKDASEPHYSFAPWPMISKNSKDVMNLVRSMLKNFEGIELLKGENFDIDVWDAFFDSLSSKGKEKIKKIFCDCSNLEKEIRDRMKSSVPETWTHRGFSFAPVSLQFKRIFLNIDRLFLKSLKYIGPLRDAPRSIYSSTDNPDPSDLGYRGEETARILELYRGKQIRYMPSSNFKDGEVKIDAVSDTLENAVSDWLQYLGIAESVESNFREGIGYELKVRSSNSERMHDLTQVGIGVSQILPILVLGLFSDEESMLVFEQPEVHLHPRSQVLLGDFFLSMALTNRQCIVESHSEHLVNRLRYRIASSKTSDRLNDLTKIFFVEKASKGSSFREVKVNEYGAIVDWPDGFFDQSYNQAQDILLAAAAKREANRKKDNGRSS